MLPLGRVGLSLDPSLLAAGYCGAVEEREEDEDEDEDEDNDEDEEDEGEVGVPPPVAPLPLLLHEVVCTHNAGAGTKNAEVV